MRECEYAFLFALCLKMTISNVRLVHPLSGTLPNYTTSSQLSKSLLFTAFYSDFHKHDINPFRVAPLFSRISTLPNSTTVHTIKDGTGNAYKITTEDFVKGSESRIGSKYILSPVTTSGGGNGGGAGKRVKRNTKYLKDVLDSIGGEKGKVVPVFDLNVEMEYQVKGFEEVSEGRKEVLADGIAVIIKETLECEFDQGGPVDLSQVPKLGENEFIYVLGVRDFKSLVSVVEQSGGRRMYIDTTDFLDRLVDTGKAINISAGTKTHLNRI
jgi:hypothetical protein